MTPTFCLLGPIVWAASVSLLTAAPVLVENADFESGPTGLNQPITGWNEYESGTGIDDNYVHDPAGQINSHVLALKADGGNWVGQNLTQTDAGPIDATSSGEFSVILDYGYRADVASNWGHGDVTLRISLWNTTTGTELASYDLLITDPNEQQEPQWQETEFRVVLNYDNTAQSPGDGLQLRFVQITPDMNENNWQATAMLDNVKVFTGPPPDPWLEANSSFFGRNYGASQQFHIPFSNSGTSNKLTIASVSIGGDDAAYFTYDGATPEVAPGESGTIDFTVNPPGTNGTLTAEFTVESNDSQSPTTTIAVTVEVTDPSISLDASQIDFGTLPPNPGPQSLTLTVTNHGETRNLDITSAALQRGHNGFAVTSAPASIAPGSSGDIIVAFDPAADCGDFSDVLILETNDPDTPTLRLPVLAHVSIPEGSSPLVLENPGFEANPWDSVEGLSPQGWISDPPLSGTAFGNYGQSAPGTPNLSGIAAHLQGQPVENYYQQDLGPNNPGLTASKIDAVVIAFDKAYRNDTATQGDIFLHVSLRDITNDAEIAGRDVLIQDTGVVAGENANQFSQVAIKLAYDNTAYTDEQIAVRIAHVSPVADPRWAATAIIDNVAVSADFVAPPSGNFASWAVGYGIPADEADDSDHDKIPALIEYALGLDPTVPNPSPTVLGENNLLSFAKNPEAVANGDITYGIETSPNMEPDSWSPVIPDVNDDATISYSLPAGQGKIFARLVVTRP